MSSNRKRAKKMNKASPPVKYLDWDSTFFKKRIARVETGTLDVNTAETIDLWAKMNTIDCVYFLADGNCTSSAYGAESVGYHLIDLKVTFTLDKSGIRPCQEETRFPFRKALETDLPELKAMARENHNQTRFFSDPHFDRDKAHELYAVWIERDLGSTWIFENNQKPVAYCSAIVGSNGTADIGLIGVHAALQGKGLGYTLLNQVCSLLADSGAQKIDVVTQGRNVHALQLYSKSGFRIRSIDLWYHKWYSLEE
jgi:dTDP-4-amino-4,6-dideoxy-D-galactose acyltransferase